MDEERPVMRAAESAGLRQEKPGQANGGLDAPGCFCSVFQPPRDRLLSNRC